MCWPSSSTGCAAGLADLRAARYITCAFVHYGRVTATQPVRAGYHHGDLPKALADAATELARNGGPEAVVLREAARQVGVSAAAAYRHFAGHGELVQAVKRRAFGALAEALADGLARGEPLADPEAEGVRRFRNLGLAYVGFARANPGLFHTAFYTPDNAALERPGVIEARIEATRAYQILTQALDELVAVGLLDESRRDVAPIALWAAVHGLATLFVDGPLAGLESPEQDAAVERTIDILMDGIRTHRA
jgi:AcrR family transcriptional regulator